MANIHISIAGAENLVDKFQRFTTGELDLHKSMGAMSLYLNRFFSGEVFASRGQVIGKPWPKLNDKYAAWKAREFPGRPPLIRSGLMNSSFKHKSTSLTTSLWNEAEYFKYHQEGEGVPERVMMHIDDKRELRIVKYVASDITTQMQTAGLI